MSDRHTIRTVHHLALTVTDIARSLEFYTDVLGFEQVMELGPRRVLLTNHNVILALSEAPDPSRAIPGDRFDENRVGLDHLSFSVKSREDLDRAVRLFDSRGVSHGEIDDLGHNLGLYVVAFRDPDNIQLELTALYSEADEEDA